MIEVSHLPRLLAENAYPGRGIVLGLCENGATAVLLYFIMGRSENSRNRALFRNGKDLGIRVPDQKKLADGSLILYTPVRALKNAAVVTNGDQTDTVCETLQSGGTFEDALAKRTFEPDAPHFTPRISGLLRLDGPSYKLSIVKCGDGQGASAFRQCFSYEPVKGAGHFLHTYQGDGEPLVSFAGEPRAVRIPSDLNAFADEVWEALHPLNKIALYARFYDLGTGNYDDKLFNNYAED